MLYLNQRYGIYLNTIKIGEIYLRGKEENME